MENYIEQISSMKYRVLNGFVSPHKAIMLLAVIDMIEFDLVKGNNFFIDNETKQSFMFNWDQYLGDRKLPYKANPWAPFWHLKHEPFWHLVPINGDSGSISSIAKPGETPHVGKMKKVIAYAELDDNLYHLFKDCEFRSKAKDLLIAKFIRPKVTESSKLPQQIEAMYLEDNNIILNHMVDYSSFLHGFTIETKFHKSTFDALGWSLEKGQSVDIILRYKDGVFPSKLRNVDIKGRKGNTLQIIYKRSNSLGDCIKHEFASLYNYLVEAREKNERLTKDQIPLQFRYSMILHKTSIPTEYNVQIIKCATRT